MRIEQGFTVTGSRADVAEFLGDVDEIRWCVPGVESVEEVAAGRYRGVVRVHVGPVKARFQGELNLDRSEAPARLKVVAKARDHHTGSGVEVGFTAELTEVAEGQTMVAAIADVVLRGRLAQFGSGVIKSIAGEMVRDFTDRINARLVERAAAATTGGAAPVGVSTVAIAHGAGPSLSLARLFVIMLRGARRRLRLAWPRRTSVGNGG